MLFTINSFHIIIIIICIFAVLDILYICTKQSIFNFKIKKQLLQEAIKTNTPIQISKTSKEGANFKVMIHQTTYLIKVIRVKRNCDLQINNFDTFIMYSKAHKDTSKYKILPNLTRFMKSKAQNRIIILANKAKHIKKVINECEMIMVDPTTDIYGIHILNYNQCGDLFTRNDKDVK